MHRINEQQIRKFLRQFANGAADILQRFTQIFAAMRRYEHNAAAKLILLLLAQLLHTESYNLRSLFLIL